MSSRGLVGLPRLAGQSATTHIAWSSSRKVTYLMLETSHPLAIAALQTAEPGQSARFSQLSVTYVPRKPLPPTTSSLGTTAMMRQILVKADAADRSTFGQRVNSRSGGQSDKVDDDRLCHVTSTRHRLQLVTVHEVSCLLRLLYHQPICSSVKSHD